MYSPSSAAGDRLGWWTVLKAVRAESHHAHRRCMYVLVIGERTSKPGDNLHFGV
jgi:hypothetical protein